MTESFTYQVPESEFDYYEWRKSAQHHGLLHDATLAYYLSDSKHLYTIAVEGELETAPIFTYRKWLDAQSPVDTPISGFSSDTVVEEYDLEAMRKIVRAVGFNDGQLEGNSEDYIWNGDVFATNNATTDTMNFRLIQSDYFTVKNSAIQLKEELYRGLYEQGVDPDADYLDVVEHINEVDTPIRDQYYSDFETVLKFADGPRLTGGSAVTVFNTGDDYVIPIITRDSNVSESAGWKNPVPAGVIQPASSEKLEDFENGGKITILQEHLLNKFYEQLLSEDIQDEAWEELTDILETDDGSLVYTASGIDCKQTYVQFYGLLFIDDPDFYKDYIEDQGISGWGVESIEFVSLSDKETIRSLLSRDTMNPYNLIGFAEALLALERGFDVDLPVTLSRT